MAQSLLRFVHAANLRLDAALRGTGRLEPESRRLAEDATLIAWQRIVDHCVEHDADFLLLTGTTFDAPPTIRARRAFVEGCAVLQELDLDVLIDDPRLTADELAGFPLPPNVVRLEGFAPVSWERPGRLCVQLVGPATVSTAEGSVTREPAPDERDRPFRIAVVDYGDGGGGVPIPGRSIFNYGASRSNAPLHQTSTDGGILHTAGTAQGLRAIESGPRGCSLVEVHVGGRIEITSLPAAVVRWEEPAVRIDSTMSREALVEHMQFALLEREASLGEKLWIVHWHFTGAGPLLETLGDDSEFRQLCERVDQGLGGKAGPRRVHHRDVLPDPIDEDDPLVREFEEGLGGLNGVAADLPVLPLRVAWCGLPDPSGRPDPDAVRAAAARLGRTWLQAADRPD